jgi:hypothetical protein
MPLHVWLALLLLVAAALGGAALIAVRALALWQTFKTFGRAVDETVHALEASAAKLTESSATLGSALPRLEASTSRLGSDLARLAVLRAAVQDARDSFGWILAVYPRK